MRIVEIARVNIVVMRMALVVIVAMIVVMVMRVGFTIIVVMVVIVISKGMRGRWLGSQCLAPSRRPFLLASVGMIKSPLCCFDML
ncbi:hypothetical protein DK37_00355 [Halomonas sp. SUBG004]|nr:hypothetical protein DK37_00355 [Halomonas sp. SUBG004]